MIVSVAAGTDESAVVGSIVVLITLGSVFAVEDDQRLLFRAIFDDRLDFETWSFEDFLFFEGILRVEDSELAFV